MIFFLNMSQKLLILRMVHIFFDCFGIYGAFVLAYFVRVGFLFSTNFPLTPYAMISIIASMSWVGFLALARYYRLPPRSGGKELYDILLAVLGGAIAIGVLVVTYFFPREIVFSRLLSGYAFLFSLIFLFCTQFFFKWKMSSLKKKQRNVYRTLIVGANRVAERIIGTITKNPYAPYIIVGVIDPYGLSKKIQGSQILGKLDKLEDICEQEHITALIQCDAFEHTLNLISLCEEKNIKFQFAPALRGIFEENLRLREVAGMTMISFVRRDFSGRKKLWYSFVDWGLRQVFDVD